MKVVVKLWGFWGKGNVKLSLDCAKFKAHEKSEE
jgi:hypothetical protein